ncbi:MAG: alpha/beta hydrolase [Zoogloeaceae bacterium]|jgi:predicted alpha/beta hydrolase family esterase|nr:alpha/beta hydrolase [Zoogloeaceae bacterium]
MSSSVLPSEPLLIVPGLNDSGPGHWQTWLEQRAPKSRRVRQEDWATPRLPVWADAVRHGLRSLDAPAWIVAHSFGCLAFVAAARALPQKIKGAVLVAPANPERFQIPSGALHGALPFPVRVIASANDQWMPLESARHWACEWGGEFSNVGAQGHINTESGHGAWPEVLTFIGEQKTGDQKTED